METLLPPDSPQTLSYNPEQRFYDDTTTWLAEALDGNMRTSFEYSFDGQELYGNDGGALKPVFEEAIEDARTLADKSPNLAFELRRRTIEKEEYSDMIDMAKGNGPNTMVVVSDFPPELMAAQQDIGGYNVNRKQTMLRVIAKQLDGSITMQSQSLDKSDRDGLEAIYGYFNIEPKPGELLEQRLQVELPAEDQAFLIDWLTGTYDRTLKAKYGDQWHGGRQPAEKQNTYDFVCQQQDLLKEFGSSTDEAQLYNLAAAVRARFNARATQPASVERVEYQKQSHFVSNPRQEMQLAGQAAKEAGVTFSGCGKSLGSEESAMQNQLNEAGYGNKSNEKTKYNFDKKMHCVVCQSPPKPEENKKWCGPCGICKSCDSKLSE